MAADGSIIISTDLDDKRAQAELLRLKKKIDELNNKIADKKQTQMPLVEQSKQLAANLDAAKAKLYSMRNGDEFFTSASIKEQEKTVQSLQKEYDSVDKNVEKTARSIQKATAAMEHLKSKAGELAQQLSESEKRTKEISPAAEEASKRMDRFSNRIKGLARRVLIFSLITAALRKIKDYMWSAIQTNDQAMASVARLKGALMTLAQPILQVVIPAFTAMVNVITRVVNAISRLVSMIFGTTVDQSAKAAENLYGEQKALKGVGSAAKKASKSLASFDEINQLSTDTGSGSGGGKASGGIKPDFKGVIDDSLSAILELFTGAALLAVGAILTFSGINIPLGIGLMAIGALTIWDAATSNPSLAAALVQNGLDTVLQAVGGLIAVIGVVLVCTGHLRLGIGMIIAGSAIFAVGTAAGDDGDFVANIKTRLTQAAQVIGVFIAVIGVIIALFSNVLLGIEMIIAGVAIFHVASAANDNGATLQQKIITTLGKIASDVGKLLAVLGVIALVTGNIGIGMGLLIAGIALFAVGETALNWDLLQTNTIQALSNILGALAPLIAVIGIVLLFVPGMQAVGIGMIIAGIGAFAFSEIAPNWDYILDKLKECWANIKVWWGKNVAPIFTAEWWRNLGIKAVNGLISGFESGLNKLIKGLNDFIDSFNRKFAVIRSLIGVPPEISHIPTVSLPRLAQGAVIPPNREFMAVLGDQKQGTNIETPLATMVQAFKQALSESGYGGQSEATLIVDGEVFGRVVYRANKAESDRIGTTLVEA